MVDRRQVAVVDQCQSPALGLQVPGLQLRVVTPGEQADVALVGGGQPEVRRVGVEHARDELRLGAARRAEEDPELVLDDVERDLAAADRPFHETLHDELGVV